MPSYDARLEAMLLDRLAVTALSRSAYTKTVGRWYVRNGYLAQLAVYDKDGNCITCGECGRCPGVHIVGLNTKATTHREG